MSSSLLASMSSAAVLCGSLGREDSRLLHKPRLIALEVRRLCTRVPGLSPSTTVDAQRDGGSGRSWITSCTKDRALDTSRGASASRVELLPMEGVLAAAEDALGLSPSERVPPAEGAISGLALPLV